MRFPLLEVSLVALAVHAQAPTPPSLTVDWGTWQSQVDSHDEKVRTSANPTVAVDN